MAGFNSDRFDIPLLAEEMLRSGIDFDLKNMHSVDIQTIFHKMEKRNLSAAYKFYCGKDLDNAHSAEADTMATYEVLLGQLEKYPELENNVKKLSEFSRRRQSADFAGFIVLNDNNEELFSFGKHKGKKVRDFRKRTGLLWMVIECRFSFVYQKSAYSNKTRCLKYKSRLIANKGFRYEDNLYRQKLCGTY